MNEIPYEKSQPQNLHGGLESVCSAIANVAERINYTNPAHKAHVSFSGNQATFKVADFRMVEQNTKKKLQLEFSEVFKIVMDNAKQDILDAGLNITFDYRYINDAFSIIKSRGFGSKSYISYAQTWEIEIQ